MIDAKRLAAIRKYGLHTGDTELVELVTAYEALREWVAAVKAMDDAYDGPAANAAFERNDAARDAARNLFPEQEKPNG